MSAGRSASAPYAGKRQEAFAEWKPKIIEAARCPNMWSSSAASPCISLVSISPNARKPPSSAERGRGLETVYRHLHPGLRPDPIDVREQLPGRQGMCSYAVLWNALKRLAAGHSAADKTAMFSGTAAKVYSWRSHDHAQGTASARRSHAPALFGADDGTPAVMRSLMTEAAYGAIWSRPGLPCPIA